MACSCFAAVGSTSVSEGGVRSAVPCLHCHTGPGQGGGGGDGGVKGRGRRLHPQAKGFGVSVSRKEKSSEYCVVLGGVQWLRQPEKRC